METALWIIAIVLVLANLPLLLGAGVWILLFAIGLGLLAAAILLIATYPVVAVIGAAVLGVWAYFNDREATK